MAFLIWQRVRKVAARHPERLAVSDGGEEITYSELVRRADAVAGFLTDRGLQAGDRVGVLAGKSAGCVAALIGASQAGACYVPVDPRSPAHRARFILENAGVKFLVSDSSSISGLRPTEHCEGALPNAERTLLLDAPAVQDYTSWSDLPEPDESPPEGIRNEDDPAYILYTSGSTGQPKGVVITHRNALTFVEWSQEAFRIGPEDRLSNHAPFHFDLSVFDLYSSLSSGASVHLVPERVAPFPGELARWIDETRISVWYSVPSALTRLLMHGELSRFEFPHLRAILFAGEVFPLKHLRGAMQAFPQANFHNLYGPTETNVCTHFPVPRPLPEDLEALPIGAACSNIEAIVVSEAGDTVTAGGDGELLIRGPCVMRGYWGLPERTAQGIVQNPLHDDFLDPVYRTGDHVRVLHEGGFQFIGRRDHMVKVRGYRVELGEIEHALNEHPAVREAGVVAVEDVDVGARLHAAVALNNQFDLDPVELQRFCLERLTRYSIPESFAILADLPRTSTGKLDRIGLKNHLTGGHA